MGAPQIYTLDEPGFVLQALERFTNKQGVLFNIYSYDGLNRFGSNAEILLWNQILKHGMMKHTSVTLRIQWKFSPPLASDGERFA